MLLDAALLVFQSRPLAALDDTSTPVRARLNEALGRAIAAKLGRPLP